MPILLWLPTWYSFMSLQGSSVSTCLVSRNYIALLLDDGRVCRIRYSEEHPPLPSNMTSSSSNKEKRRELNCLCESVSVVLGERVWRHIKVDKRCVNELFNFHVSLYECSDDEGASTSSARSLGKIMSSGVRVWMCNIMYSLVSRWPVTTLHCGCVIKLMQVVWEVIVPIIYVHVHRPVHTGITVLY